MQNGENTMRAGNLAVSSTQRDKGSKGLRVTSVRGLLARPDASEHTVAVEPVVRPDQEQPAERGDTVHADHEREAVRVQPRLVREDDERLLRRRGRETVLRGETDRVLIRRTHETFLLENREALVEGEIAVRIDDLDLVLDRFARREREVLLSDVVVHPDTALTQDRNDLVGRLGTTHHQLED